MISPITFNDTKVLESLLTREDFESIKEMMMFNPVKREKLLKKYQALLDLAEVPNEAKWFSSVIFQNVGFDVQQYGELTQKLDDYHDNCLDAPPMNETVAALVCKNLDIWKIAGVQPIFGPVGFSVYANLTQNEAKKMVIEAKTRKFENKLDPNTLPKDQAKKFAEELDAFFLEEIVKKSIGVNSFIDFDNPSEEIIAKVIELEGSRVYNRVGHMSYNVALAHEDIPIDLNRTVSYMKNGEVKIYTTSNPFMKDTIIFGFKIDEFNCGLIWNPYVFQLMRCCSAEDSPFEPGTFTPRKDIKPSDVKTFLSSRARFGWFWNYPEDYYFTLKFKRS